MIIAIIQARLGSTRFPKKIFSTLADKPLIWHVINRLKYSKKIDKIVLATTDTLTDNELATWAEKEGVALFRGSESNVLERFYLAAKQFDSDIIVRITADDPFKDPVIIDRVIDKLLKEKLDFAYNNYPPSFPEGLDTEVFTFNSLERAYTQCVNDYEREHVTQFFYRNKELFKQGNFANTSDLSHLRWTIDTELDYSMANEIYKLLYNNNEIFLMDDILEVIKKNPKISEINKYVPRTLMYKNNN